MKIGILLVNLGTPDSPKTADVRKYLTQFLTDSRVIDIPFVPRQFLVRGIIGPFRSFSSAKLYKELWDEKTGSPLLHYGKILANKLQESFNETKTEDEFIVKLAMRYQSPSIENGLKELQEQKIDKIVVFPLFPQYASATTGSVHQEVMRIVSKWWEIPDINFIRDYYVQPDMVKIFAENGAKYKPEDYDHILFSFHGLPQSQLRKANMWNHCLQKENCCETICEENKFCYSSQCHATAKAIAEEAGFTKNQYSVCFQSRLGPTPWAKPYTSEVLEELAKKGAKKVLVYCPAFVADCLETILEIADEYQEEFEEMGGEHVQLVESLNDHPKWIETVKMMLLENVYGKQVEKVA